MNSFVAPNTSEFLNAIYCAKKSVTVNLPDSVNCVDSVNGTDVENSADFVNCIDSVNTTILRIHLIA